MMDTVTHLAGPAINIGGRIIQRCSICGERLVDSLGANAQVNRDGTLPHFVTWPYNTLVQAKEESKIQVALDPMPGNKLPDDSCIELLEN